MNIQLFLEGVEKGEGKWMNLQRRIVTPEILRPDHQTAYGRHHPHTATYEASKSQYNCTMRYRTLHSSETRPNNLFIRILKKGVGVGTKSTHAMAILRSPASRQLSWTQEL